MSGWEQSTPPQVQITGALRRSGIGAKTSSDGQRHRSQWKPARRRAAPVGNPVILSIRWVSSMFAIIQGRAQLAPETSRAACECRPISAGPKDGSTSLSQQGLPRPECARSKAASSENASGSRWKKYQRAQLDAFSRRRIRSQRVVEGGMEREPGATVIGAVVHPDEQRRLLAEP